MITYVGHKICYLKVYYFPIHFYGDGQQLLLLGSLSDLNCSKTKFSNMVRTAQPQGNVCTCPRRIPDLVKRAWQLHKSCCSFIIRFCTCMDASHACSGCVLRQTCANVTLKLSCTVGSFQFLHSL